MNQQRFTFSKITRFALLTALLFAAGLAQAQIHVSVLGSDDTGNGTLQNPYASLSRAFSDTGNEVWMTSGEYFQGTSLNIPPGWTVRGGFKDVILPDNSRRWVRDQQPTTLLFLGVSGLPAVTVNANSRLEWVSVAGGFYSAELLPRAHLFEVEFLGGQLSSIIVRQGQTDQPAVMERSRVLGGGAGIRVEGTGNLAILDTLIENTQSRALSVTGTGVVGAYESIFQKARSGGIAIIGNSNVLIENCVVRRNAATGISVSQSAPIIRGSLIERNESGIELIQADETVVEHCTIVENRQAGAYVREAQPDFLSNIFAYNANYGVYEDKPEPIIETNDDGTTYVITFDTHVGSLSRNMFWGNNPAEYYDEGDSENGIFSEEDDINQLVENVDAPLDNRVVDPMFADQDKANYRLAKDSPAIDLSPEVSGFNLDLDGNQRLIDIDDVGGMGTDTMDLGAFERQEKLVRNFATLYAERGFVTDPIDPENLVVEYNSPEWQYSGLSLYNQPRVQFLPGRLRFTAEEDKTFGAFFRRALDFDQNADQILVYRPTVAANDQIGVSMSRLRVNGPEALDVVNAFYYLGTREYAPTVQGREYELIVDLRQGGYRRLSPEEKATYQTGFHFDMIEFLNQKNFPPLDYTRLEVEAIDREIWDAQYNQLVREWSFNSASEVDWIPEGASVLNDGNNFNDPRLRYSSAEQALELSMSRYNTFGWWKSPGIPIKAGERYKIDFTVSTPQPTAGQAPWFRFRTSTTFFEISDELIIQAFPAGNAAPTPEGETYTLYGRMPEELIEVYDSDMIELVLYIDMFGLFTDRPANVTLYLEDVTVWSTSSN